MIILLYIKETDLYNIKTSFNIVLWKAYICMYNDDRQQYCTVDTLGLMIDLEEGKPRLSKNAGGQDRTNCCLLLHTYVHMYCGFVA